MKNLDAATQQLIAFGFMILTWLLLIFFLVHASAYQEKLDRVTLKRITAEVDLKILKLQRPKCGEYFCYTGQQFVDLYNDIEQEGDPQYEVLPISFNPEADKYMRSFAEARGYKKRSNVSEHRLVEFNELRILPEVRDAYLRLRNRMSEDGIELHLVSAYRSFENQRSLFLSLLGIDDYEGIKSGLYDEELSIVLERSALPGYSKHHSGYAVDFGCGDKYLVFEFFETECYQWMKDNNFQKVKKEGFIPSYPQDVEYQGPRPEPWEYVWVGVDMLK